jgi:predicted Co/Zn/Cd cation transporter (cation efflux family)
LFHALKHRHFPKRVKRAKIQTDPLPISLTGILLMAAIALYAFYTSLGGRPIFGAAVLEE